MKKRLFLFVILASLFIFVNVAFAATDDFVVANQFSGQDAEGYYGPYGPAFELKDGVLVFDSSVDNAWITLNFKDDELAGDAYKYAVITLKTDNPEDAAKIHMTLGNVGKSFTDWGITLGTDYKTYVIDLKEHGLEKWGDGTKGVPDFALNKAEAKNAKIYVSKIVLTNTNNAAGTQETNTNTESTENTSTTTENPKTGDNTNLLLITLSILTIIAAMSLYFINRKVRRDF